MRYPKVAALLVICFFLCGCALVIQKGRRSDLEKIDTLERELTELKSARSTLERDLAEEIKSSQVKLEMKDKGLVITVLAEVLFDSGKARLRREIYPMLDKVANVLREKTKGHNIGIEGHTDNQPIKYSGWKSNWELSSHRALSVLHYLEGKGIGAHRLSAIGYGEYRPLESNDTPEGRQANRRVEIVVIPHLVKKLEPEQYELIEEEMLEEGLFK